MGRGLPMSGHQRQNRGATDVWLTPPAVLRALGPFDLDPCAAPEPRPWPTAARMLCPPRDGLSEPWWGRVWLNPPYGPEAGAWLARLARHGDGVALLFARTETAAFRRWVWGRASGLLFLSGRLHFRRADGSRSPLNAGAPSVLVAYGVGNAEALRCCGLPGGYVEERRRGAPPTKGGDAVSNNQPDLFALYDSGVRSALLDAGWVEGEGPTAGRWRDPASKLWLPAHEAAAKVKITREDDGEIE